MRLLFLVSEFPPGPGGIGTHAYQLAYHLTNSGWDILVITPQDYAAAAEIEQFNQSQPFKVIRLSSRSKLPIKAIRRWHIISKWIKAWEPDIVLASGDRPIYLACWLARYHQQVWVAVEHGRTPTGWEYWLKRYSLQQATTVVCVSQYTRQQMQSKMGVRTQKEAVILNGADDTQFKELPYPVVKNCRADLKLAASHLLITVGNVTQRKGQEVVIKALPTVLEKFPDTHYLIVGLPLRQKALTHMAQQLGVEKNVHFLGKVDATRLVQLLNCCDLFVMTSRHADNEFEGFGIAVIEAALCGKPAIVSANSGLAEAIVNGQTGLSVPEDDELQTARAIITLLQNDSRRQEMGQLARKRALAKQTWASRIKEYDYLLRRLLPASPGSGMAK